MEIVIPGGHNLALFISAALALLLVPGPAVLFIFARSIEQGRLAGLVSILGIHAATLVHVALAALGLSAILASSAVAFSLVKYAGAAYLIWIGVKKLIGGAQGRAARAPAIHSRRRLLRDGFVVNLFNPKTALFFLAFLPQFVEVERGHVAMQIAFLGMLFATLGMVTDGCYAFAAGAMGEWFKRSPAFLKIERWVSGVVFIGLGVTAAFAGNRNK